jgi:two-component system nitrogen regulation sensor histidine kinase NtrY
LAALAIDSFHRNNRSEMSAQEMVAWQTVIRVMAHEVMNSLTPVSSLAATAHDLVTGVIEQLPADDPCAAALTDAAEALETNPIAVEIFRNEFP